MRRTLVALGLTGALALAGCGLQPAGAPAPDTAAADVADAAIALQQVGFDTGLAGTPAAGASAGTGDASRKALRKYLRKNTLHGEVAIQTRKDGVKTVVVQRGSVTAVTAGGVSVKSADGFALTWTFGDKLRVVQDKRTVAASALKTGAEIGIAGVKDGDATTARLIAVK
jgi:hypothetical protein